jgi:hypothetical protein
VCTAATLEIGSLVLAASSTYVVAGTRRRVRGAAQSVGRGAFHDSLLVRALLFNVALAGALVCVPRRSLSYRTADGYAGSSSSSSSRQSRCRDRSGAYVPLACACAVPLTHPYRSSRSP